MVDRTYDTQTNIQCEGPSIKYGSTPFVFDSTAYNGACFTDRECKLVYNFGFETFRYLARRELCGLRPFSHVFADARRACRFGENYTIPLSSLRSGAYGPFGARFGSTAGAANTAPSGSFFGKPANLAHGWSISTVA